MQLVWDMDGTLLDSGVVVPAAYVATVRELGGPAVTPEQVVERYWLGHAGDDPGRPAGPGRGRRPRRMSTTADWPAADVAPYPGVADVLAALRERGHPVAVFTGASSRAAAILLTSAGVARRRRHRRRSGAAAQAGRRRPACWRPAG